MELNLKGKQVLITGGARGIGFGIAQVFASEGCKLHLASHNAENLQKARDILVDQYKVVVHTTTADLAKKQGLLQVVKDCGVVDVLVNNAGAIPREVIEHANFTLWREQWDLKVFGYLRLTQEIYRQMRERKRGVIVNIVGTSGERPYAGHLSGSMANAALIAMSRALGAESVKHGVRLLAINPGAAETSRQVDRFKAQARKELGEENRWRELISDYPFGRLVTIEEVGNTVAFLASDRASYMSGTVITLDGGDSARM